MELRGTLACKGASLGPRLRAASSAATAAMPWRGDGSEQSLNQGSRVLINSEGRGCSVPALT